jgi:hypothetical protein
METGNFHLTINYSNFLSLSLNEMDLETGHVLLMKCFIKVKINNACQSFFSLRLAQAKDYIIKNYIACNLLLNKQNNKS